ncbi:hypothetical protein TSUD_402910 [Trifolium subterraneum]|uniref:CCHC-type domain-containing protein n=1 Tax=Trifolium subterraneum TaxID=3900 RepID=A0A2Z6NXB1_TRISU|nr:hypothetical protein TSUD_402910 [Trifolium subterraneum]
MDGPWFIYDHYLTVKEWGPNFHPASDTIEEVAVWLRISGLPIEYYDSKILHFIGDTIGQTTKVDKNTLTQEWGKYARLCVQVNLTKPLVAMFMIKDTRYNIEYEGLHMLCTRCGRFGHYKEGCSDNEKVAGRYATGEGRNEMVGKTSDDTGKGAEGPWRVVQKHRRNRKATPARNNVTTELNESPVRINAGAKSTGSRFDLLSKKISVINREGLDREEEMEDSSRTSSTAR